MTIEMRKGESFYLCKNIEGPYEAICPEFHSAIVYNLTFPTDATDTLLMCADCAEAFENDEKKYRGDQA